MDWDFTANTTRTIITVKQCVSDTNAVALTAFKKWGRTILGPTNVVGPKTGGV